jgi:hypothetical protein
VPLQAALTAAMEPYLPIARVRILLGGWATNAFFIARERKSPPSWFDSSGAHPMSCERQLPGTSASTRSGLPEPFWIFSGAAKITAPVGGS